MITQKYKLNIIPRTERMVRGMTPPTVYVSQYDKGLRTLVFDLYDGANGRLTLPEGQTAKIYGKKPDANVFEYSVKVSDDRQSVSIVLQEQMAVIAGCVKCEVRIYDNEETAGSANFILAVEKAPVGADDVYSESDIPEIDNLLYGGEAGQVFTKTTTGARWADLGTDSGFMMKWEYDPDDDGSVKEADHAKDASTVDGFTVSRNVLAGEYDNATIDAKVKTVQDSEKAVRDDLDAHVSDNVRHITASERTAWNNKVNKETGKGLSTNDFTTEEKNKLKGIETGAQVNSITGVKGDAESTYRTGNVNITKANIGLGNVDNTKDADKPVSTATQTALDKKVDKVSGKGLSANDFTDALKTKLEGIADGATKITVDSATSTSSTNPVQNKIITQAVNDEASARENATMTRQERIDGWLYNCYYE